MSEGEMKVGVGVRKGAGVKMMVNGSVVRVK